MDSLFRSLWPTRAFSRACSSLGIKQPEHSKEYSGNPQRLGAHVFDERDILRTSSSSGTLVPLAKKILELSRKLEGSVKAPTFQNDTLADLDPQLDEVRKALINTSKILNSLARGALGPFGRIQTVAGTYVSTNLAKGFVQG